MIRLRQPSIALHAHDVPGYKYAMWSSRTLDQAAGAGDVRDWIVAAHKSCPGKTLHNVVLNCHGGPGEVLTGGQDAEHSKIDYITVHYFSSLAEDSFKDITTIWLVACEVASTDAGKQFCSELAIHSRCNVVAADKNQHVNRISMPYGCIDNFEGNVSLWDAAGRRTSIRRNARDVAGTN